MKSLRLLLVLLWLLTPTLYAADELLDFSELKGGTFIVVMDANGKVVSVKQITIRKITLTPPGPGPVEPDVPVPDVLSAEAKSIKEAAAKAGESKTATDLAAMYNDLSKKIKSGEIKGTDSILAASRVGADTLIKNPTAWKPFRDELQRLWVKLAQEGGNDLAYAKLLEQTAIGLSAATRP